MKEIVDYLSKYKNIKPPHASTVKLLIQTICDECGVKISESDVSIKRGGAVVNCHPTVRSEITRCSPDILLTLQKKHKVRLSFIR